MKGNKKCGLAVAVVVVVAAAFTVVIIGPATLPSAIPPYQRSILSRFPVSLDLLFKMDQPTQRNNTLNGIKSGMTEGSVLFVVPYPNYFHSFHSPATLKWYLYAGRPLAVSFPIGTHMNILQDRGNSTETINGTAMRVDLHVVFALTYYVSVILDHVCINQSLFDAWQVASTTLLWEDYGKWVSILGNTTLGYTHNSSALDFYLTDKTVFNYDTATDYASILHAANPFFYFTPAAQAKIMTYYQSQYDAMKQSGLYVEGAMNRTYNINEANSIFGTWFYHNGFMVLNSSHHQYGWYAFDGAVLNILNVNKTDRPTLFKDRNTGLDFNGSMIGVYYDAQYVHVAGYSPIGGKYMYHKEGSYSQGIACLSNFFANTRSGPIFMKYQLIPGGSSMFSDMLRIEYFTSLVAAQGSFTASNLTYVRLYEHL